MSERSLKVYKGKLASYMEPCLPELSNDNWVTITHACCIIYQLILNGAFCLYSCLAAEITVEPLLALHMITFRYWYMASSFLSLNATFCMTFPNNQHLSFLLFLIPVVHRALMSVIRLHFHFLLRVYDQWIYISSWSGNTMATVSNNSGSTTATRDSTVLTFHDIP